MITCARCGGKCSTSVEAHTPDVQGFTDWDLCFSCYGYFLELMNVFIHTTKVHSDGESVTLA